MTLRAFASPDELATELAETIAAALKQSLAATGRATLAVSGGNTPKRFFAALAKQNLDWQNVTITLVDDRWVPLSSDRSNARLVKEALLRDQAAAAQFLPLVTAHDTPEAGRFTVETAIKSLALPLTAAILGMGEDGHTASFFPGGDRLADALDPPNGALVESMRAGAAGEPRITLTWPILRDAGYLAIHIEGEAKQTTLIKAEDTGPIESMPIRIALSRHPKPEIFWCP